MRMLIALALPLLGTGMFAQYGPQQTAIQSEIGTVSGLATGDLNGDGYEDIAIAGSPGSNPGLGSISARFGLGGGAFGPSVVLGTVTYYYGSAFCILDINNDGVLDIKTQYGWLPGLGSGVFGAHQSGGFTPGSNMADLDGDGDLDMVARSSITHKPAIFWNDGVGNFSHGPSIGTASGSILSLYPLAADVTGDGITDIVIGGDNPHVGLWPGLGDGTYGSRQLIPTLGGDQRVVFGDMDGDGDIDIARSGGFDNLTAVLSNDGAGTFAVSDTIGYGLSLGYWVADIDHDGDLDLSRGSGTPFGILDQRWHLNDGTGTNWTLKTFGTGNAFQALADFDQDGLPELVMGKNYQISLHEWSNADQWSPRVDLPGAISGSSTLASGDFDMDGDVDLCSVSCGTGEVYWTANNGDGTFGPMRVILTGASCVNRLLARDVNGDVALDLIGESNSGFRVLINNGAGATWTQTFYNALITGGYTELDVGDMDGDGDSDIVDHGGWWVNDGSGAFTGIANSTWSSSSARLKLGDMNNDGLVDVVCGFSLTINTCINQGGGVYVPIVNSPGRGSRIELADMNEDGYLDVVNVESNGSSVYICINDGSGGLTQQEVYTGPSSYYATTIAVDDINGDGHQDVLLVLSYSAQRSLRCMLGTGLGTVGPDVTFGAFSCSAFNILLPADIDGDHVNDVAYPVLNGIAWQENLFSEAMRLRCFLEGPYMAAEGMMHDSLRTRGLIPLHEPYTELGYPLDNAGAQMTADVLNTVGANAIVDWIIIELRDANDPSVVHARSCALLQRDGDVVGMDGSSPLIFPSNPNSFFVAIRHRNHFGVMSASAMNLNSPPLDMTSPSTPAFGIDARKDVSGVSVLWAGNVLPDHSMRYVGADNDRDPILVRIGGSTPTATAAGYFTEDVNMDGTVKYAGTLNDREPILVNIGGNTPTNTRTEQVP